MQKYSKVIIKEIDLRKLITRSGKTITQIAIDSGITRGYIYSILAEKTIMSEDTWELLKKALNKS